MNGNLPWAFVSLGAFLGLSVELMGIGCLPFAVGLYLPFHLSAPIMLGPAFAFSTSAAWDSSRVLRIALMAPRVRKCFVIFRVSTPSMATISFSSR